jgi:ribosomal protein L32
MTAIADRNPNGPRLLAGSGSEASRAAVPKAIAPRLVECRQCGKLVYQGQLCSNASPYCKARAR